MDNETVKLYPSQAYYLMETAKEILEVLDKRTPEPYQKNAITSIRMAMGALEDHIEQDEKERQGGSKK